MPLYQAWYRGGMWSVAYLREAESELGELPPTEQVAIRNAVEKLKALGPELRFPHSSKAMGADDLRELRPRAGRCAWRALYRRIGTTFVIAAIAPDGGSDPGGFGAACFRAEQRLAKVEDG
jgi:hypothetical protein